VLNNRTYFQGSRSTLSLFGLLDMPVMVAGMTPRAPSLRSRKGTGITTAYTIRFR
jgi:hypothetical protein